MTSELSPEVFNLLVRAQAAGPFAIVRTYYHIYDVFDREFFDDSLPQCLMRFGPTRNARCGQYQPGFKDFRLRLKPEPKRRMR